MTALTDFHLDDLQRQLAEWGFKPVHAGLILRRFYEQGGTVDLETLDIGAALRARLRETVHTRQSTLLRSVASADGTVKLLVGFESGGSAESVFMPGFGDDAAGCISSQIGCAMGCDFCASTKSGLERNLTAGEIVEQFLHLRALGLSQNRRLKTLVFMGMGEPMHNLENVIAAIRRIGDSRMGSLGWKQIAVSTVGIVPGIDRLADADLNVALALSLHAPDDATRATIVPANRRYAVADIMEAAKRYQTKVGRIVNVEYCMLAGVNDSDEQAHLLAQLMDGFRAHVNLIPYNWIGPGVSGRIYQRPSRERIASFRQILLERNVVTHVRRTRGDDVSAACGQLRQSLVELSVP